MRALHFDDRLSLVDAPVPVRGGGEALVRVTRSGICNTDIEIARGYMGFRGILGHELVGVVEDAEDADLVGARVTGEINLACERCAYCRDGLGRHCPTRTVLGILGKNGCHAEYVTLPVSNLHRVPETIDDDAAVFIEPLAAAFEILEQVEIDPADQVAVLGDGKLGLLAALVLADAGLEVTVIGRHDRKLALVAPHVHRTSAAAQLDPRSFDVVVEATGSPAGLDRALTVVKPRGVIVLKSTFHGAPEVRTSSLVIDEVTLVGSRCGPFAPAIAAIAERRIDPRPLISARYPLSRAMEAFETAQQPGVLKVLLEAS